VCYIKEDYHMYCIYNDRSNPDLTFSNVAKYAENIGLREAARTTAIIVEYDRRKNKNEK
jgi:hypothetical protein